MHKVREAFQIRKWWNFGKVQRWCWLKLIREIHEQRLLHKQNAKQILGCKDIRLAILKGIKNHLAEDWSYENVSGHPHHLHHHETCLCEFRKIGKKKKDIANKKIREFYNKECWQEITNMYKDRAQTRKELLEKVMQLQTGSNLAEMEKESILDLLKRMK